MPCTATRLNADEVSLVVKHTFLEYVMTPDGKPSRRRALTDTDLLDPSAGLLSTTCAPTGLPLEKASPLRRPAFWPATPMMEAIAEPDLGMVDDMASNFGALDMQWLPPAMPSVDEQNQFMEQQMLYEPWMFMPYGAFGDCYTMQPASWEEASTASGEHSPQEGSTVEDGSDGHAGGEWRTTVMLRSLPNTLTRELLRQMLDDVGFYGMYDLVYLPVDFSTGTGLGYAFINITMPVLVPRIWEAFSGLSQWPVESDKVCTVSWSDPHQGLGSHIERYQNSPVMHQDVPDGWKPALFMQGMRVEFPMPTKKIKAPKVRSKKAPEAKCDEETAFQ